MFNINSRNVSEAEEALVLAYNNMIAFGKLFLPGDFMKSKSPPIHYEIAEELDSDSTKPLAIIIARDHGKTTLVKCSIIKDFCFAKKAYQWGLAKKERHLFYGWVSSSQRKSKNNVAYIRLHLEKNEMINYYFGDINAKIYNLRGDVWNQEEIVTSYGDKLVSSSNLTSMRGDTQPTIKAGNIRFKRVFCDDCENEENTKTKLSRDSIVNNIMDGILPAIETSEPACRLVFIGTPVHFASMAQGFIDKHELLTKKNELGKYSWKIIVKSAVQPNLPGGVLWNDRIDKKALEKKRLEYIQSPKGEAGYYQEYELKVQSSKFSLLTKGHIKRWRGFYLFEEGFSYVVVGDKKILVNTFLGCDPATDIETKDSDYSVIMVIAVDQMNNVLVLDYVRFLSIPTIGLRGRDGELEGKKGVVDYIFDMYEKYHCLNGTVEDVAMTRSVFQALYAEGRRRGKFLSIVPEKPGGRDKINKIYTGLSPRFASGSIFLQEGHYDLEHEILTFGPRMSHDDVIETLFFACANAYPPASMKVEDGKYIKKVKKVRNWKVL